MIASKDYMTSVVMGKDVVPRLGLHQMETLRHELIATVRQSKENKVKYLFIFVHLFVFLSISEPRTYCYCKTDKEN